MKRTIDFKKVDKTKIILWSIAGLFCTVGLVTWIVFSFGTVDERMNGLFFDGMSNSFIRGWTAFTISDCYIVPFSYALPLAILILESIAKWLRINKPNWWLGQHAKVIVNWVIGVVTVIYVAVIAYVLQNFMFQDYGFGGKGFNVEFMTGNEYLIPILIVSILINATVYGLQIYYYHNKLAPQDNFLARKLWRKAWIALIFLLFAYVPILVLKMGFGRPYWFNVHFNDGVIFKDGKITFEANPASKGTLWRIHEIYGDKYVNDYLGQTVFNYGWQSGYSTTPGWIDQQWPTDKVNWYWWKLGDGWFGSQAARDDGVTRNMHAFPSGHLQATMFVFATTLVWFDKTNDNKKTNRIKWTIYSVAIIYVLQMIFALEVSGCHWWSDMAFTMFWSPIAFYLSRLTVNGIFNRINKNYNTLNW